MLFDAEREAVRNVSDMVAGYHTSFDRVAWYCNGFGTGLARASSCATGGLVALGGAGGIVQDLRLVIVRHPG